MPHIDSPTGRHHHWRADVQQRQVFANGSDVEKLKRAVERALPKLPSELREKIQAMLTPEALATLVAIAALWGASHWFGVGEVVDVILIGWGVWTLGAEALDVGKDLYQFVTIATHAQSNKDIDRAADYFARAIAVIGIDGLAVILAHKAFKSFKETRPASSRGSGELLAEDELPARSPQTVAPAAPKYRTTPMNDAYVGEDLPNNNIWGTQVKYLSDAERAGYKLEFRDGKIYDSSGRLFDTQDAATAHSGGGRAIFVMDENGNIYASKVQQVGEFHHSSLAAGQPVAAAGEMSVQDGVLKVISDKSGHYTPGRTYTQQALDSLQSSGIDTSTVQKDFIGQ
jgi:hypothetical protein